MVIVIDFKYILESACDALLTKAFLLVARTLLVAPGLTTRSKDATSNKGHRY